MGNRLSRFGVGPKIVISVIVCAAFAGVLTHFFAPACFVPAFRQPAAVILAILLIAAGLPLWLIGAVSAMKAYNRDQLVTTGVFALVRHPMYGAWIALILPGIALLTASWPFLLMPLVGYLVFQRMIHVEDEYLEDRFGASYSEYRASVNEIVPFPRVHHHRRRASS